MCHDKGFQTDIGKCKQALNKLVPEIWCPWKESILRKNEATKLWNLKMLACPKFWLTENCQTKVLRNA